MPTPRNPHSDYHDAREVVTGVDTDGSGQFTLVFGDLRRIPGPEYVDAQAAGGYVVNCVSVTDNQATFEVFQGGGADSELAAVTGSNGVTDVHATAVGY
jgi:hypothetical protein